jgi:hypothetical protein
LSHPPQFSPPGQPQGSPPGGWSQPPQKQNTGLIAVLTGVSLVAVVGGIFLLTSDDDDDPTATSAESIPDCVHPNPDGSCPSPSDGGVSDAGSDPTASPEAQAYIDALAEVNESTSQGVLSTDEARCISAGIVDAIGLEGMQVTTPDEIRANPDSDLRSLGVEGDQAQIDRLAGSVSGCLDASRAFIDILEQQGAPGTVVDCLTPRLDADVAASFLAASYAGAQDVFDSANSAMEELLASCDGSGD